MINMIIPLFLQNLQNSPVFRKVINMIIVFARRAVFTFAGRFVPRPQATNQERKTTNQERTLPCESRLSHFAFRCSAHACCPFFYGFLASLLLFLLPPQHTNN
jgi:hypothetical protein